MLDSAQIAAVAAKALEEKKAQDVKVLRVAEHTILADYFVICSGTSSTHVKALVDEVDRQLHRIMDTIYENSVQAAERNGLGYNLVAGANIAGFERVADAMMAQGLF